MDLTDPAPHTVPCPKCRSRMDTGRHTYTSCPRCGWQGQVYLYEPPARDVSGAEEALAEDAVCAHHPNKRAESICEGTGTYICALCAVELEGKTYSVQYLDAGGKKKAKDAFDRYLARPDRYVMLMLVLCIFPYTMPLAFIWLPLAIRRYFKILSFRKENELYAQLVGVGTIIYTSILLGIFTLGAVIGIVAIIVNIA